MGWIWLYYIQFSEKYSDNYQRKGSWSDKETMKIGRFHHDGQPNLEINFLFQGAEKCF